ncbi:4Fe-4S dicluster domain-containing protein [Desulforhabdus amnigena]|jgi:ferredoxin|uniref:4Fe-4S ferredoxin n=1 Tax=Desulforhabdus amnigena TaxID=40218 RepID=A0A9W6LAP0_9BACT|nr:4Fe-4S dicluster domain-containing protein [Desulforhabdus amnigena]NLJ27167.1 4Fe-4S ferredoxin [Deltaproteobacteria bacterium]GLI36359.1 4Fe-4S ferredoxin [Desulforhabdus amnigena]
MSEIYIVRDKFPGVVQQLMGRYRVYGPVFQGQYHEYAELKKAEDLDLNFQNTRMSPKGLFHPEADKMFEYSLAEGDPEAGILKEIPKDYSPRVILGIRPCDAKAFQLDDVNFITETIKDTWWVERRKSTTLVGLACNAPCSTCFCTTVGTGPFDPSGLDVLMIDMGEGYVVRPITDKGKELVSGIAGDPVPQGASEKIETLRKTAEDMLGTQFDVKAFTEKNTLDLFNDPLWDEVQFSCINCGTCTFLCPTCWCFDIQDEVCEDKGERLRLWDSCMFPLFTLHGSGHNPRAQKLQRVRQRFMHKLKYYPEKYGNGVACVGCGRCVKSCPVNIDIRQVARMMASACVCPA